MTNHGSTCLHLANKSPLREMEGTLLRGCLTACGGRIPGRRVKHWCPGDSQMLTLRLATRVAFPLADSTVPACYAADKRSSQGTVAARVLLCVCVFVFVCTRRAFPDTVIPYLVQLVN